MRGPGREAPDRLEGVTALVNFATERAKIAYPDTVSPADLLAQVEAIGVTGIVDSHAVVAGRTGLLDDWACAYRST